MMHQWLACRIIFVNLSKEIVYFICTVSRCSQHLRFFDVFKDGLLADFVAEVRDVGLGTFETLKAVTEQQTTHQIFLFLRAFLG